MPVLVLQAAPVDPVNPRPAEVGRRRHAGEVNDHGPVVADLHVHAHGRPCPRLCSGRLLEHEFQETSLVLLLFAHQRRRAVLVFLAMVTPFGWSAPQRGIVPWSTGSGRAARPDLGTVRPPWKVSDRPGKC